MSYPVTLVLAVVLWCVSIMAAIGPQIVEKYQSRRSESDEAGFAYLQTLDKQDFYRFIQAVHEDQRYKMDSEESALVMSLFARCYLRGADKFSTPQEIAAEIADPSMPADWRAALLAGAKLAKRQFSPAERRQVSETLLRIAIQVDEVTGVRRQAIIELIDILQTESERLVAVGDVQLSDALSRGDVEQLAKFKDQGKEIALVERALAVAECKANTEKQLVLLAKQDQDADRRKLWAALHARLLEKAKGSGVFPPRPEPKTKE